MDSAFSIAKVGDFELVIQVGTGVVDPPLFPTRIALLNLYFWTKEDDEDDEFPLFLTLQCCCSLLFASIKLYHNPNSSAKCLLKIITNNPIVAFSRLEQDNH